MIDDGKLLTEECIQGNSPPCMCACPFLFDTRQFLEKIKNGNFNAAYREYANHVIFPGIVSRICGRECADKCSRGIDLLQLERAAVKYSNDKEPIKFNLPRRAKRIAIIGAGLSGLACLYQLAMRNYDITIIESARLWGGSLNEWPESAFFRREIKTQLKYSNYKLILEHKVTDLSGLEFDAAYVATGKGGDDFGLLKEWNSSCLSTGREGVFLGGKLTGKSDMEALYDGILAARFIENYLKIGKIPQDSIPLRGTCSGRDESAGIHRNGAAERGDTAAYSIEKAITEAGKCTGCGCTECLENCLFLSGLNRSPRKVEADILMARATNKGLSDRMGTRMIASCSVCGHCGAVCPKNISFEPLFIESKRILFEDGAFAPAFHDFFLRDMKAATEETYLAKAAPDHNAASYLFFPGCQMTAAGEKYTIMTYEYMLSHHADTALMMSCCGVPALWSGDHRLMRQVLEKIKNDWMKLGKPIFVFACMTCKKTFDQQLPEITGISLYEFINEHGVPDKAASFKNAWAIFDPCSSRSYAPAQQAVRMIAKKLGIMVRELPDSKERAGCCGVGGHVYPANPGLTARILKKASEESAVPYIAYCMNCRNLFLHAKKDCAHLLDMLFGMEPLTKPYHIASIGRNRYELKRKLLKEIWNEESDEMHSHYKSKTKLHISEEVLAKMDRLLISEDEVSQVVERCEQNKSAVWKKDTDTLIGHKQIGIITYWVEYQKNGTSLEVINAYCHRLQFT